MAEADLEMMRRVLMAFEVTPSEVGLGDDPVVESRVRLRRQRRLEERATRRAPGDLAAMVERAERG